MTIEFGSFAVLHDLVEVALQHIRNLTDLSAQLAVEMGTCKRLTQFVDQLNGDGREIIDEIEWVLDLVCDPSRQLTERSELLRLDQAVLGGPQILQRFRQFAGASFYAFEQAHVLDRDRGLVRKCRYQFNLLVSERSHL